MHKALCWMHPALGDWYWRKFIAYKVSVRVARKRKFSCYASADDAEDALRIALWAAHETP